MHRASFARYGSVGLAGCPEKVNMTKYELPEETEMNRDPSLAPGSKRRGFLTDERLFMFALDLIAIAIVLALTYAGWLR